MGINKAVLATQSSLAEQYNWNINISHRLQVTQVASECGKARIAAEQEENT